MRRVSTAVFLTLLVIAGLSACSSSSGDEGLAPKPFCESVAAYEDKLVHTGAKDRHAAAEEQLPALEKMLRLAPADIKADVQRMRDGYQSVIAGQALSRKESDEFAKVIERVERYGINKCGLLKQNTGGGI